MNHNTINSNQMGNSGGMGNILGFLGTYCLYILSGLFHSITMQNVGAFFTALSGATVTFITLYNFFKKPKTK
jgi:uncharacterized membrane protein YeaQ/YmgE (transglycosylase-associated protein family)